MTAFTRFRPTHRSRTAAVGLVALALLTGCVSTTNGKAGSNGNGSGNGGTTGNNGGTTKPNKPSKNGGSCIAVPMAVSSEKITVLTELADNFNASKDATANGTCIEVKVAKKSSGAAANLLVQGWNDEAANGIKPVIWSPAASAWGGIVNQRVGKVIAPTGKPFMLTPLVIAMPAKMATAIGYPGKSIGFKDIVDLANDKEGWAKYGHPEWGPFRLGKTNPNFSTSGLNFTIAQYYAATGKTRGLTTEDLARPEVAKFSADVENAVVHYGDITMTFLNNWFAADLRSSALTYASAVAVEEKSLIDYNLGNPDGELSPGERPRPPKEPLVAIYPSEGTLFSDSPFIVLDTDWVSADQKAAAAVFQEYVMRNENQRKVLEFGFRPGNPNVPKAAPIEAKNGVDPNQPQAVLDPPAPEVLIKILDTWGVQRKTARVLLVIDVSGSMGDPATTDSRDSKLDLAKRAAISALDQFKDEDEVGLRIFSTALTTKKDEFYLDLVPVGPIGAQREGLKRRIDALQPVQGTPLYNVAAASYETMITGYDPAKINAVVLLTDGKNDDGVRADDASQLANLLSDLQSGSEGAQSRPVRVFPIAYGKDADLAILRQIAEATRAAVYDASNPATIEQVFTNVVSNF
jgi:Ca-activated chloride channel homolog